MRVLVTGSTGFIGSALVPYLKTRGHEVVRLVRKREQVPEPQVEWSPNSGEINAEELQGIEGVVHLAGESVFSVRWTQAKKERIRDSRVNGTQLLSRTLAELPEKPRVLVSSSAIAWYGDGGDKMMDETEGPSDLFLAQVCRDWEAATTTAEQAGIRVVKLRTGIVLHPSGGVLRMVLMPFKLGVGGVVGPGTQYIPWIAREDMVAAIEFCLTREALRGPVNATAPNPVTNREFTQILASELKRPALVPVPAAALRAATGQMADEMLLGSFRVIPARLKEAGFEFKYGHLQPALRDMLQG